MALLIGGIVQGLWLWGVHNRLQDVALLSARESAAGYRIPTARLRADELKLDWRQLVIETQIDPPKASVSVRYPVKPWWLASLVTQMGGVPWLSATAQAFNAPSARQPLPQSPLAGRVD